jgi:hypothetical protein
MRVCNPISFRIVLTVALVVVTAVGAAAQGSERPLPDVELVLADATRAPLRNLAGDGQWLVVYLALPSPASARLLEAMTDWSLGAGASRLLIVTSKESDARALFEQWGARLPGARWAADPDMALARGLNLRGAPSLVGARSTQASWVLAGVLNDPGLVRDVVRSWVTTP